MGQMTRKDYENIALTIKMTRDLMPIAMRRHTPPNLEANFDIGVMSKLLTDGAADFISESLARQFKQDNPAFDVELFLTNCGHFKYPAKEAGEE